MITATEVQALPAIVQKAIEVATHAHNKQVRKDGTTPYIEHPLRCLELALNVPHHFSDEELAALVLHDVIEDTLWPFMFKEQSPETNLRHMQMAKIFEEFDIEVAGILWLLTKPTDKYYRRKIYMASLRRVAPSVIALKLIDGLANLEDLPAVAVTPDGQEDPGFADFFKKKVKEDFLPLIDILRMHGDYWIGLANWFETWYRKGIAGGLTRGMI